MTEHTLTDAQVATLANLCSRYGVAFNPHHYFPQFDLPEGYVAGWIGGSDHADYPHGTKPRTLYVGVSPEGNASS